MCKPEKWGALWVYSMFPHVTHRHISLTTDTFNSLVLIPNFQLSYWYSVSQKQPLGFLKTSENLQKNNKKTAFLVYILRVWKLIYSFFLTLETFFLYFKYISLFVSTIFHFSIAIFRDSLEYQFHHLVLPHEIHFQKEFFEGNLPFIPLNIITSWLRSASTNTGSW